VTSKVLKLGVNIDHVATLRQARGTTYPDVIASAHAAIDAGADSITVHLREDRRHIQDRDVEVLVTTDLAINLELAVTDEMIAICERLRPRDACFVPERREELTTEGGLDVLAQTTQIESACKRLQQTGIQVSLFIDPDEKQIEAAAKCGAQAIEIHTGTYADATDEKTRNAELARIVRAADHAADLGLKVHAGHGLHTENVGDIAAIKQIIELNIGHALVARAVFIGLSEAVKEMRAAMDASR